MSCQVQPHILGAIQGATCCPVGQCRECTHTYHEPTCGDRMKLFLGQPITLMAAPHALVPDTWFMHIVTACSGRRLLVKLGGLTKLAKKGTGSDDTNYFNEYAPLVIGAATVGASCQHFHTRAASIFLLLCAMQPNFDLILSMRLLTANTPCLPPRWRLSRFAQIWCAMQPACQQVCSGTYCLAWSSLFPASSTPLWQSLMPRAHPGPGGPSFSCSSQPFGGSCGSLLLPACQAATK